jgi:hypothetical protein
VLPHRTRELVQDLKKLICNVEASGWALPWSIGSGLLPVFVMMVVEASTVVLGRMSGSPFIGKNSCAPHDYPENDGKLRGNKSP